MRDLRSDLFAGEPMLGAWLMFSDAYVAEAMAHAGFDWLLVDMEHGPIALHEAAAMVTAIRTTEVVPFVRVAWNDAAQIQRVLDLGCAGIVVPVVNTAADARKVVVDARFPPLGERSRGAVRPLLAFGTDAPTYFDLANDEITVLVQIETVAAVANVEEILAVAGIDGVFLGPNDLAASHGARWPEVWNADEAYMAMIRRVGAAARDAGKIAGFLARDAAMAAEAFGLGYRFLGVSSDIAYLRGAAGAAANASRAAVRHAQDEIDGALDDVDG